MYYFLLLMPFLFLFMLLQFLERLLVSSFETLMIIIDEMDYATLSNIKICLVFGSDKHSLS